MPVDTTDRGLDPTSTPGLRVLLVSREDENTTRYRDALKAAGITVELSDSLDAPTDPGRHDLLCVGFEVGIERIIAVLGAVGTVPTVVMAVEALAAPIRAQLLATGAQEVVVVSQPGAEGQSGALAQRLPDAVARHRRLLGVRRLDDAALRRYQLMKTTFDIVTQSKLDYEQQIELVLRNGCNLFDEDIGIVSLISGKAYHVKHVHASAAKIAAGDIFNLDATFCEITLRADGPLGIADVEQSEWHDHPCINTGLKSYIGAPLVVDGRRYGTLNFSSERPKAKEFPALDLQFVSALAEWVGGVLTRAERMQQLERQALHDPLTGLPNRKAFGNRLESCVRRSDHATAAAAAYSFAVLFLDLDGFKRVNDEIGHDAGDALLREVAQRLRAQLRPKDDCARFAGDEFVAVLEDVDQEQALAAAQRIHASIVEPVGVEGAKLQVGCSIGVVIGTAGTSGTQLLTSADQAMYRAKRGGQGVFVFERGGGAQSP